MRRMIEVKELKDKIVFGKDIGTKEVVMGVAEIPESLMVNGAHDATDEEKAWIEKYAGYRYFKFNGLSEVYTANSVTNTDTTYAMHICESYYTSDGSQFMLDALVEYLITYSRESGLVSVTFQEF